VVREEKLQDDVADLDFIRVGERGSPVDGRAVEIGAVAAPQILEEEVPVSLGNLGMLPANGGPAPSARRAIREPARAGSL